MLLPKRLLALENETQLRKQEKQLPERESVQLQQEKVLEEKLQDLQKEELPGEEGDARTSYTLFEFTFDTNCQRIKNKTKNGLMLTIYCTPAPPVLLSLNSRILR